VYLFLLLSAILCLPSAMMHDLAYLHVHFFGGRSVYAATETRGKHSENQHKQKQ
jgi:hypothetical protein